MRKQLTIYEKKIINTGIPFWTLAWVWEYYPVICKICCFSHVGLERTSWSALLTTCDQFIQDDSSVYWL